MGDRGQGGGSDEAVATEPPEDHHDPSPDAARQDEALLAVRRRGAFLVGALLWAAALGGLTVAAGAFLVMLNLGVEVGQRLRLAAGLRPPEVGPDWFLLAVHALVVALPVLAVVLLALWYRRVWRRRVDEVWEGRPDGARLARIRRLRARASRQEQGERAAYLSALLSSPAWQALTDTEATQASDDAAPIALPDALATSADAYRTQAEFVLEELEEDVAARAIATGLVVGLGPGRLDRLTIVVGALEMQLHVLSRLGKKPSLRTWMELIRRTSASLFFSTYLNREDTLLVSLAIRKLALGMELVAELGEGAVEGLSEAGEEAVDGLAEAGEEAVDEAMEGLAALPVVGGLLKTAGSMTLGIGAFGLKQVADVTRSAGEELLQGAVAGGVLYHHGMAIAADALALDEAHRRSPRMTRSAMQGATRAAGVAGRLLRAHVKQYRALYRERRRAPLRAASRLVPRPKPSKEREPALAALPGPVAEPEEGTPPAQGASGRWWRW